MAYSRITVETQQTLLWLPVLFLISRSAVGMLTLSPMTVAPVCHVGDPLNLTCTASVEFITWRVFHVNERGMLKMAINDEPINSEDSFPMPEPIVSNLAAFTFTRISAQFSLPLTSTLSIDSVSIGLNGSVVNCMDGRSWIANKLMSASTTIQIIDTSQSIQLIPELNTSEPHYDADNVTVTVEWTQQEPGVVYSVEVSPLVPIINYTKTPRYQLTLPYNKTFNFSIMATTPCRPNITALKFITLNFVKCKHPRDLLSAESNVSVSIVGPDNGFPVKGSTARFSCPSGWSLIGSHSAKCTENGEWESNLDQIMCHYSANSYDNTLVAAVSSTVIIFLVISILTFIGGFISGVFIDRKFYRDSSKRTSTSHEQPRAHQVPLYDDVLMGAASRQEENVELKQNVAYRSPKPAAVEVN